MAFVYRCLDCDTALSLMNESGGCVICNGSNIVEVDDSEERRGLNFGFTLYGCDACGGDVFEVDAGELRCRECGEERDVDEDRLVAAREEAYGDELQRMSDELHQAARVQFLTVGPKRLELSSYVEDFAAPLISEMAGWPAKMTSAMSSGFWDEPQHPDTSRSWREAGQLISDVAALVKKIKRNPPPIGFLGYHRGLAGTAAEFGFAALGFFSALVAPSRRAALEQREASQDRLDRAASVMVEASSLRSAVSPWTSGGDLTWCEAEERYGSTFRLDLFPELRSLFELDAESAQPLWSLSITSASLHDFERRKRRSAAVLSVLMDATAADLRWSGWGPLLHSTVVRSCSRLFEADERLYRSIKDLRTPASGESAIREVLAAAASLAEGPFRHLGALICVALKASRNGGAVFEPETFNRSRALSDALDVMKDRAPVLVEGLDVLMRNGHAHNVVDVTDSSVSIERVDSRMRTKVALFSYGDVVDHASNLHEASVALAMTVVSWLLIVRPRYDSRKFREDWLRSNPR